MDTTAEDGTAEDATADLFNLGWTLRRSHQILTLPWTLRRVGVRVRVLRVRRGGPMAKNGEKWRKMAKNGDGEFGFFICQIRHFSPIFDF